MPRITRKQWADFHAVNAPPNAVLPDSINQKPYEMSGEKRGAPETDLQITLCQYLALKHPALLVWATPNHLLYKKNPTGAQLHQMERQKKAGLHKGACDLNIFGRNKHGAPTLALAELKIGYAKPDPDQLKFMDTAEGLGAYTSVVRSLSDLQNLLESAGFK